MAISLIHSLDEVTTSSGILSQTGTGGLKPASGDTAERPSITSNNGLLRYNTDTNVLEVIVNGAYTPVITGATGGGTVTSITFTGDGTVLSSTPSSAVTTSGTLNATLNSQLANKVLAGPTTGSSADPTFRSLVAADLPSLSSVAVTSLTGDGIIISNSDSVGTVTLTLASGTQGDILYQNGTTRTTLAPGASGQVLTTGGASANPSWQTPSTGALVLLATVNASNISSVTFGSTYITSAYNKYVIEFDSVTTSTATSGISMQISTNNGSSWINNGYLYAGVLSIGYNSTIVALDNNSSEILITSNLPIPSVSTEGTQGTIKFSNPSAAQSFVFEWNIMCINTVNGEAAHIIGSGYNSSITPINAINISPNVGGGITGNFHLYGIVGR